MTNEETEDQRRDLLRNYKCSTLWLSSNIEGNLTYPV